MSRAISAPTAARLANLRTLVLAIQERGELLRDQVPNLVQVSPSCAREYLRSLRDLGAIELARYDGGTPTSLGCPVYRLAVAADQVAQVLADLATKAPKCQNKAKATTQLAIAARQPGRRFHIMGDDAPYAIRVSRAPAMRDPLVAAFFGAAAGGMEARA